ncbi:MAG: hypothetical protein ABI723_19020 [Bacteroidia bacterium]
MPAFVKVVEPKEREGLLKYPVTCRLPEVSRAIDLTSSIFVPPVAFAQTKFPELSNLEMKISWVPAEVKLNVILIS